MARYGNHDFATVASPSGTLTSNVPFGVLP
jgi:hypothetical protein